jgi:hypothetical protein
MFWERLTASGKVHGMCDGVVAVDAQGHQDVCWGVRDDTLQHETEDSSVKAKGFVSL